jgi:hypothetical protein
MPKDDGALGRDGTVTHGIRPRSSLGVGCLGVQCGADRFAWRVPGMLGAGGLAVRGAQVLGVGADVVQGPPQPVEPDPAGLAALPVSPAYWSSASPGSIHRSRSGGASPTVSQPTSISRFPVRMRFPGCGSPCVMTLGAAANRAARPLNAARAWPMPPAAPASSARAASEYGPPAQAWPTSPRACSRQPLEHLLAGTTQPRLAVQVIHRDEPQRGRTSGAWLPGVLSFHFAVRSPRILKAMDRAGRFTKLGSRGAVVKVPCVAASVPVSCFSLPPCAIGQRSSAGTGTRLSAAPGRSRPCPASRRYPHVTADRLTGTQKQ